LEYWIEVVADVATIVGVAGSLVGRTRLQKTVSLLEMTGLGYGFTFDYHRFGPFSEDLVVSTDRAVALNYVIEEERRASWGAIFGIQRSASSEFRQCNSRRINQFGA
jgi:uncharacterized protein YwgA